MMTKARRFRDGDSATVKFLAGLLRQRVVSGLLLTLSGGAGTALLMRFFLLTQLNAQAIRISHVEVQQDTMRVSMVILVKSACLDRTPAEQDLAGMECPRNLYKGVLQGVQRGDSAP